MPGSVFARAASWCKAYRSMVRHQRGTDRPDRRRRQCPCGDDGALAGTDGLGGLCACEGGIAGDGTERSACRKRSHTWPRSPRARGNGRRSGGGRIGGGRGIDALADTDVSEDYVTDRLPGATWGVRPRALRCSMHSATRRRSCFTPCTRPARAADRLRSAGNDGQTDRHPLRRAGTLESGRPAHRAAQDRRTRSLKTTGLISSFGCTTATSATTRRRATISRGRNSYRRRSRRTATRPIILWSIVTSSKALSCRQKTGRSDASLP